MRRLDFPAWWVRLWARFEPLPKGPFLNLRGRGVTCKGVGAALRVGLRPPSPLPSPRRGAGWRGVAPAPPLGTALGNRPWGPVRVGAALRVGLRAPTAQLCVAFRNVGEHDPRCSIAAAVWQQQCGRSSSVQAAAPGSGSSVACWRRQPGQHRRGGAWQYQHGGVIAVARAAVRCGTRGPARVVS